MQKVLRMTVEERVKQVLSHRARKAAKARWVNTPTKRRTEIAKAAWVTRRKNLVNSIESEMRARGWV